MTITMREMLEAGVHFGHQTRFWNPKMAPYIYGHRNKIHIINLEKTQPLFEDAMKFVRQLAARRGTILMIGTKRQAREVIAQEAKRCGMPFVAERWLGGTLTNYRTIRSRLARLEELESILQSPDLSKNYSKKMESSLKREYRKIKRNLSGIRTMDRLPGAIFSGSRDACPPDMIVQPRTGELKIGRAHV